MKMFPLILLDDKERTLLPSSVPWDMVEPGREQAQKNHQQSLECLAQRGGLCPSEVRWVLEGRKPSMSIMIHGLSQQEKDADVEWLLSKLKERS